MLPAGWNYCPGSSVLPSVDLTVPPPQYPLLTLADRLRQPDSGLTELVKSIDARDSQLYALEEANQTDPSLRPQSIDVPSLVSMEILESHARSTQADQGQVVQQVTEMKRILSESEKYLSAVMAENTRFNSNRPQANFGRLEQPAESDSECEESAEQLLHRVQRLHDSSGKSAQEDMLPRLLEAENNLLEMVDSLNALDGVVDSHCHTTFHGDLIDLAHLPPPESGPICPLPEPVELRPPSPYSDTGWENNDSSNRLVRELNSLCERLLEMRTSLNAIDSFGEKEGGNEGTSSEALIEKLVIPPPPIERARQSLCADQVISRLWMATSDVKQLCRVEPVSRHAHCLPAGSGPLIDMPVTPEPVITTTSSDSECDTHPMSPEYESRYCSLPSLQEHHNLTADYVNKSRIECNNRLNEIWHTSLGQRKAEQEVETDRGKVTRSQSWSLLAEKSNTRWDHIHSSDVDRKHISSSSSKGHFPKPPIPPSVPSIKGKRRRECVARKESSFDQYGSAQSPSSSSNSSLTGSSSSTSRKGASLSTADYLPASAKLKHSLYGKKCDLCDSSTNVYANLEMVEGGEECTGLLPDGAGGDQLVEVPEYKRSCFQTKEMEELFAQTQLDIDTLLARLEEVHETRLSAGDRPPDKEESVTCHSPREMLLVEARHLVNASKMFVKCATEASFQLIDYLTECVMIMEHMFTISEVLVFRIESQALITCLVDRLKEVAATYAYTVGTVQQLMCYPNTPTSPNPFGQLLVTHATSLTTSLSTLMRTLRSMA